ncbi:GIN domain-containing protein [Psychroserpens luteus]|uniref:GIN domain-containing protein n=1 Tax=Psychroserpens luteus TaxID=1434066 RepID=A0ABW5ZVH3_9FLAO|nr:DUF2807 domain-containing protein [Psychroserpens luteus]
MKNPSIKFTILIILLSSFFSCNTQSKVKQISKKINFTNYEGIELVGSPTVNLIDSDSDYIDISADERIIDYVNVINEGGVLKIFVDEGVYEEKCSSKGFLSNNNYCDIIINIPLSENLNMISLKGNGDIILKTELITASDINFFLKGNGDIESKKLVKANNLSIELEGNGDINLFNLDTKIINAKLTGNGDIVLQGKCIDFISYVDEMGDIDVQNLSFETKKDAQKN